MWYTPDGERVLSDPEWLIVCKGAAALWFDIRDAQLHGEDLDIGIARFESLTFEQQTWSLYTCLRALREPAIEAPDLTAAVEATIGAIYAEVEELIGDGTADRDLAAAVIEASELGDDEPPADSGDWQCLIDSCADRILWDRDFEFDVIEDADPDEADRVKVMANISPDYFAAAIPEPTPAELATAIAFLDSVLAAHPPPLP